MGFEFRVTRGPSRGLRPVECSVHCRVETSLDLLPEVFGWLAIDRHEVEDPSRAVRADELDLPGGEVAEQRTCRRRSCLRAAHPRTRWFSTCPGKTLTAAQRPIA